MKVHGCILLVMGLLVASPVFSFPSDTLVVQILGTGADARFEPMVIQVQPGDVIKFEVAEGVHTVTAYHPENRRPQRIPEEAASFNSGMLTESQIWTLKITTPGVYDYFCLPHERMGHAGRILVGEIKEIPDYPLKRIPASIIDMLNRETKKVLP